MSIMSGYPSHNFASNPKPDASAISARLGSFVDGRYKDYNLSSLLYADRRAGANTFEMDVWTAPGRSKPTFDEAKQKLESGEGKKIGTGFRFGPSWTNHWVRLTVDFPSEWKSEDSVELIFDPSCEGMIFDESGLALQGITGGFDYNRRVDYIIPKHEVKAGACVRYIEVSANGVFGVEQDPPQDDKFYQLVTVEIGVINTEARQLMWDFETLRQLSEVLPEQSPLANKARWTANRIMTAFKGSLESVKTCRIIAQDVLGSDWQSELKNEKAGGNGTLWALGYCHIDTAWLWPWSATQQKVARSWSNQIDLMDRYPEYRFMATSAQHFQWLEQLYPKVFQRLQEKIRKGNFEINGGCWVEMDGNMPSGESFCRQFLLGQRYFQSRFGKRCDVLVLPDTFGFSAQLPQIARLGGCTSFFTHKLNWNRTNVFPLTTFNWVGLDGSQVLTHITPILRYDSDCTIAEIDRAYKHHKNLDSSPESLILYGHGDGGGGPTPVMLERLRRARAAGLAMDKSGEGLPLVKTGVTLSEFFEMTRSRTRNGTTIPDWNGELYLEIHRATMTSQARTKSNFRRSEILLRDAELFSTLASIHSDFAYPKERLNGLWESLCLCMFHDTLPGSSIHLAVQDYDATFSKIRETGDELCRSALRALEGKSSPLLPLYGTNRPVVLNTLSGYPRKEIISLSNGESRVADVRVGELCGVAFEMHPTVAVRVQNVDGNLVIQNGSLKVTISAGRITSIIDVGLKRELVAEGATAGFIVFEDRPPGGDAWEIEQYTFESFERLLFEDCRITASSELRATVDCTLKIGHSVATVKISLDALPAPASVKLDARSLIRFDCVVDWHERHKMLKFELPLDLWSTEVTYDSAFGVTTRPTTRNNSWETSKFEVAAHKFADYSEFGYGVAIVNNNKYGYSAQGNVMSISLLRAPTMPDQEADQGRQEFGFGIYPHLGKYAESDVHRVAQAFNNPLRVLKRPIASEYNTVPFTIEGASNVMLETIKRGEDDFDERSFVEGKRKTVVIRLYEHMGGHASVRLVIKGMHVVKAAHVNILEEQMEELDVITYVDKEAIDLDFRAFAVKTVQLTL